MPGTVLGALRDLFAISLVAFFAFHGFRRSDSVLAMSNATRRLGALAFISALVAGCASSNNLTPLHANKVREQVYEMDQVDQKPDPKFRVRPEYPPALKKNNVTGECIIQVTVKTDGHTADAVVQSATDPRFGDAALKAVLWWEYRPAQLHGKVVPCRINIPFEFSLDPDPNTRNPPH